MGAVKLVDAEHTTSHTIWPDTRRERSLSKTVRKALKARESQSWSQKSETEEEKTTEEQEISSFLFFLISLHNSINFKCLSQMK